jgi:hypothetical protein
MLDSVTFILADVSRDFDVLAANIDRKPFHRGVIHRYAAALSHFSVMERKPHTHQIGHWFDTKAVRMKQRETLGFCLKLKCSKAVLTHSFADVSS